MEKIIPFDWYRIFVAYDTSWLFLAEVALRTAIMFLFLLLMLKFLSKRGVKQLSVFELAILIALGSASGDPMFYYNIPLLMGMVVLMMVIAIYRLITHFTYKISFLEMLLEGKPVCLLRDGRIDFINYKKVKLPYDKFFSELRLKSVDHLGQVRLVYLETSGEMSVYLQTDENIGFGLPIYPELIAKPLESIGKEGLYSCIHCGKVENLHPIAQVLCPVCSHKQWLPAWDCRRIGA